MRFYMIFQDNLHAQQKKYRNRMPKYLPNQKYLCTIWSIRLDKRGKSRSLLFNENVIRSINHHGQNCIASKT